MPKIIVKTTKGGFGANVNIDYPSKVNDFLKKNWTSEWSSIDQDPRKVSYLQKVSDWALLKTEKDEAIKLSSSEVVIYAIADYFKSEYSKAKRGDKARIYEDAIETADESYFQRLALDVYDNVMGSSSSVLHDNVGLSSLPSFALDAFLFSLSVSPLPPCDLNAELLISSF